jgi:LuxR family transcriptional regulator, maltose regulon positive regulatory protein
MTLIDDDAEAALHRQTPKVQWLLLSTSILDKLCGPLCDAVSGQGDSAVQLQQLSVQEPFIKRDGGWFTVRRHYTDVWRNRLFHNHFDQLSGLHHRASAWYAQHGDSAQAIRHALAAGDKEGAVALILRAGPAQLEAGSFQTILNWLGDLPEPAVRASARLCLLHANALLMGGHHHPASQRLAHVIAAPDCGAAERAEVERLRLL